MSPEQRGWHEDDEDEITQEFDTGELPWDSITDTGVAHAEAALAKAEEDPAPPDYLRYTPVLLGVVALFGAAWLMT